MLLVLELSRFLTLLFKNMEAKNKLTIGIEKYLLLASSPSRRMKIKAKTSRQIQPRPEPKAKAILWLLGLPEGCESNKQRKGCQINRIKQLNKFGREFEILNRTGK